MGSIATIFQNYQFPLVSAEVDCPELLEESDTVDDDETNCSNVSMMENDTGTLGNISNVGNYQAQNMFGFQPPRLPPLREENDATSDDETNYSTVSMNESNHGVTENRLNCGNHQALNFVEYMNLDDTEPVTSSEMNFTLADGPNSVYSSVESLSILRNVSNLSEQNFVTENTAVLTEDLLVVETDLDQSGDLETVVHPLPGNLDKPHSELVLKNGVRKLNKSQQLRKAKSHTLRGKKHLGICKLCKLTMQLKTKRNASTTKPKKRKASRRKAKPFRVPRTVQTVLKYTSAVSPPKPNSYQNFVMYYNVRCRGQEMTGGNKRRKARHVWKMMNAGEKRPFCLLAMKERRQRLKQSQRNSRK